MATILVDVDGPVADLLPEWLRLYNIDYGDELTPDQIANWDMTLYVKRECGPLIYEYLDGEIYDGVDRVSDALDGVNKLREMGHRVIFVTSSPEGTGDAKYTWLKRNKFLPDGRYSPDYIEAHDKSLVRGDILIDDRLENVKSFPGETILWDAPYNRSEVHGFRAHNWADVVADVGSLITYRETAGQYKHPTELRCPEQAKAFREVIEQMYQIHLSKNKDYSSGNILGLGTIGVVVRAWDKMARLLNLHGFKMDAKFQEYVGEQPAKHESIEDSWLDLANYSIIALLVRKGVWGR